MTDLYCDQMTNDRPVLWPTVIATDQSGPSIMTDWPIRDQNYSLVQVSSIESSYLRQYMILEETVVHLSINGDGSSPELKSKGAVLPQSTEHHEFWADRRLFLDKVAHLLTFWEFTLPCSSKPASSLVSHVNRSSSVWLTTIWQCSSLWA